MKNEIKELKRRLLEISHLSTVAQLVGWDQEVNMPPKASGSRAIARAELSAVIHTKALALDSDGLLTKLKKATDEKLLSGKDKVIVLETWRDFVRSKKLPESFIREMSEVTSKSQVAWMEARKKSDYKLYLPWLTKIVELKRQEAEYVGYTHSPYDALIDEYEPGMTTEETVKILNDLKDFLVPFLKKIKSASQKNVAKEIKNIKSMKGKFAVDKQVDFNKMILKKIGFDFDAGRLDVATHPFASGFHPHDVRITSRYAVDNIMYSVGSTIHEAGHGLYEQGLPVEHFGTPLAQSLSLGIHESQSRLWENMVGKSLPFWKHFYPLLVNQFPKPFSKISVDDFYRAINTVGSTLIRTESDEVTYNLHIILRFEIEREMIEGTIDLKKLPSIWNAKVKEYFDIDVPNDALGVLQDIHWACGGIGYFPTYSFGNLYSAQFFSAMEKQIPGVYKLIEKGDFTKIRQWLKENIHATGKTYSADKLVRKITGESLNSRYFAEYLTKKYSALYDLKTDTKEGEKNKDN